MNARATMPRCRSLGFQDQARDPAKVPTEFVQVDKLILQFIGEHWVKNSQDVTEEAEDVGTWEMHSLQSYRD